ncbi:unnamed protein product, partial [Hapterophycus canaliculatus]
LSSRASRAACPVSLQLALSMDGKMVATASSRGTLLRVFDTDTGSLL